MPGDDAPTWREANFLVRCHNDLSPSLLALYIDRCIWNTLHGRIPDAWQGIVARHAGRMVIAKREYRYVPRHLLQINDPNLQRVIPSLMRGELSALPAMVRSLWLPVAPPPPPFPPPPLRFTPPPPPLPPPS